VKRPSFVIRLVAVALAVLLPAESAHCAWMMSPVAKAPTAMRADHACCRAAVPAPMGSAAPRQSAPDCACLTLPQAVATVVSVTPPAPEAVEAIVVTEVLAAPAAGSLVEPSDTDASPPRAPDLTAHPLRGPPTHS